MKDVFYFIGLNLAFLNLVVLLNIKKHLNLNEWLFKFIKVKKRAPILSDYKPNEYKFHLSTIFINNLTFLWVVFGLITTQWKFFVFMAFLIFMSEIIVKVSEYNIFGKIAVFIRKSLIILIMTSLVFSHFHPNDPFIMEIKNFILQK